MLGEFLWLEISLLENIYFQSALFSENICTFHRQCDQTTSVLPSSNTSMKKFSLDVGIPFIINAFPVVKASAMSIKRSYLMPWNLRLKQHLRPSAILNPASLQCNKMNKMVKMTIMVQQLSPLPQEVSMVPACSDNVRSAVKASFLEWRLEMENCTFFVDIQRFFKNTNTIAKLMDWYGKTTRSFNAISFHHTPPKIRKSKQTPSSILPWGKLGFLHKNILRWSCKCRFKSKYQ